MYEQEALTRIDNDIYSSTVSIRVTADVLNKGIYIYILYTEIV
jgi:hypothetical protein